jgi:hypothetical protein
VNLDWKNKKTALASSYAAVWRVGAHRGVANVALEQKSGKLLDIANGST